MADQTRAYKDIPGTYVFDGEHHRKGYALNMMCMSLNDPANRDAFREDQGAYIDKFGMTPAQKTAVLERDWLEMLRLGGNIYYTYKIAAFDGLTFRNIAAKMSGVTEDDFAQMMMDGGRSPGG